MRVLLLLFLSLSGCLCVGRPSTGGYAAGHTFGPQGVAVALPGTGRLGALAFADDGGLVALEWPLEESDPTFVHLFTSSGQVRGKITLPDRARLRVSPRGDRVATVSGRQVAVWSTHDGTQLFTKGASRTLFDVTFSADATQVIDLDEGGAVRFWDLASGTRLARLVDGDIPTPTMDLSADGRTLVVGRTFDHRIWDLATGLSHLERSNDAGDDPLLSPDGRWLASARPNDEGVALYDRLTKTTTTAGSGAFHRFSSTANWLAAETSGHDVVIRDLDKDAVVSTLTGACDSITDGVFSPDAKTFLAASNDGGARLWDVATGRVLAAWHLPVDCAPSFNPPITHVAFRNDGKAIALGFYEKTLELVNLPAELASAPSKLTAPPTVLVPPPRPSPAIAFGDRVATLSGGFSGAQFAPDSTMKSWRLALGTGDGTVRVFHGGGVDEPEEIAALGVAGNEATTMLVWSADGTTLVAGDHGGRIQVLDVSSTKAGATWSIGSEITALAVIADGRRIAAGAHGRQVGVWTRDGTRVQEFDGHTPIEGRDGDLQRITTLAFSPDGTALYSGSNDFYNGSHGNLRRWSLPDGTRTDFAEVASLGGLSVSPNGTTLAYAEDKHVVLRNTATGTVLRTLGPSAGRVNATAFVPESNLLATVDDEEATVRLWDLTTGAQVARIEGEGSRCGDASLSLSGDGALAAGLFHCMGPEVQVFAIAR